jgi:hypothetical protein
VNEFLIGIQGQAVVILRRIPQCLTKRQALEIAAWLAVLADPTGEEFADIRRSIEEQ